MNSAGVMPIIFSTSSLSLPATLARFTGLDILKKAAVALTPGGNTSSTIPHILWIIFPWRIRIYELSFHLPWLRQSMSFFHNVLYCKWFFFRQHRTLLWLIRWLLSESKMCSQASHKKLTKRNLKSTPIWKTFLTPRH